MTDTATPAALVTPEVKRKNGGMPDWAFLGAGTDHEGRLRLYWPYTSDVGGRRFLTRFILFRTPWASMDITRISMADDQREYPHDHSRTFWSWKWGWYAEDVYDDPDDLARVRHVRHRRLGVHRLRHDQAHSITEVSPHLVTVLFLGRRRQKSSYWTPEGKQTTGMAVDQDIWA
jgi:hypothetical protein